MKVYFATPIRGERNYGAQIVPILKSIADEMAFTIISQHELITGKRETLEDTNIYQRDINWLNEADCVVAEISNASTGVGYELYHAIHVRQIPVLVLWNDISHPSAMITGIPMSIRIDQCEWAALEDVEESLIQFFSYVEHRLSGADTT